MCAAGQTAGTATAYGRRGRPSPPSHRACAGVVTEFVRCVRATPCVRAEGKSVTDCAAAPECVALRGRLLECRRRAVDARSRIQGNKLDT